jgi:ABC-2 type transport system ATP-binding protein
MLEVVDLTKRYGDVHAVDGVTFTARPGVVTGFLGPNGAGKTTTMRMILGLDRPTSGSIRVNGRSYLKSSAPLHELGALLDAKAVDKGRSARNHLRAIGATVGVGTTRVDDVLELVGLTEVARRSAGSYSLGMGQRLGIASALLADPSVVMLDEPVNGLDPDGILWIRNLLKRLAAEGRTVFVSSHLMSEMEQTAEHLIVIGRGRVLADLSMTDFIAQASTETVRVSSPEGLRLREHLLGPNVTVTSLTAGRFEVQGLPAAEIGAIAAREGITLHELARVDASLEQAFMELTKDSVEFRGGDPADAHSRHETEGEAA